MTERTQLAAQTRTTVVGAGGVLALFNDAGVLDPLDVASAQVITRLLDETDERVVLAAALTVRGTRFGHVCVRLPELRQSVVVDGEEAMGIDALPWPEPTEWQTAVAGSVLVGDGSGEEPLVLVRDRLYLERYYRFEQQVAELIRGRIDAPDAEVAPATRAVLDRLLSVDGAAGSQHAAALKALGGKVAVVAGGPGTGKTYTVGALLVALASSGSFPSVAVCAPTGKAAARLGEALAAQAVNSGDPAVIEALAGVKPSTIHRLLGWSWGRSRFARDGGNPLPHDLVIVDEMSMVSLPLAARLLSAVRPDAGVVLVGDPFQLESIEAGTVLADIVGPATEPDAPEVPIKSRVVVLDRVHRFEEGGVIAEFADAVRLGDPDAAVDLLGSGTGSLRWVGGRSEAEFAEMWGELVSQRLRMVDRGESGDAAGALAALGDMAVLCAHRDGPDGVSGWSRDIEAELDEGYPGLRWGGEWYPGRPVMITRNDHNLQLFNGDIGVAVRAGEGMQAVFERGELHAFPLSHLTEHVTVHAMTIHKAQGSQFEEVVVVLPGEQSRLLTRELLYTAVTRARRRVWLVGAEDVVRQAVARTVQRASGLGDLLWRTEPKAGRSPSQA